MKSMKLGVVVASALLAVSAFAAPQAAAKQGTAAKATVSVAQTRIEVTDMRTCVARANESYQTCTTNCAQPLRERNICLVWCKRYRDGQMDSCRALYR